MQSYLVDLGRMNYEDVHHYQLEYVRWRLLEKQRPDIFIVVEHPPVFTLGWRGERGSVIVNDQFLKQRGVKVLHTAS